MVAPWVAEAELREFVPTDTNEIEKFASLILGVVKTIRNLKSEIGIDSRKKTRIILRVTNGDIKKDLAAHINYVSELAFAEPIFSKEKPAHAMSGVTDGVEIFLPLEGLIDTQKEIVRLGKELEKLRKGAAATTAKLGNERFLSKAPAEVVTAEREKLSAAQIKISSLEQRINQLESLQ